MRKKENCKKFDQLDPKNKNLTDLKVVSKKLGEVSNALKQLQLLTDTLGQAVDIIAKNFAILNLERIDNETTGQ